MRLSAIAERRDDTESSPPQSPGLAAAGAAEGGMRMPAGDDEVDVEDAPKIGWVTLVKDGQRLVSSRLRLDANSRQQHQDQWARRMGHDRSHQIRERDLQLALSGERAVSPTAIKLVKMTGAQQLRSDSQRDLSRAYSLELRANSDATSFAFGGVYPGVLHAHGKPHAWHKVCMHTIHRPSPILAHARSDGCGAHLACCVRACARACVHVCVCVLLLLRVCPGRCPTPSGWRESTSST